MRPPRATSGLFLLSSQARERHVKLWESFLAHLKNPSAQFRDIYGPESERTEWKRSKRFQSRSGRCQINPGITLTMCLQDLGLDSKDEAEIWKLLEHSTVRKEVGEGGGAPCCNFKSQERESPHGGTMIIYFFPGEAHNEKYSKYKLWQVNDKLTPKGKTLLCHWTLTHFLVPSPPAAELTKLRGQIPDKVPTSIFCSRLSDLKWQTSDSKEGPCGEFLWWCINFPA